MRDSQLEYFGVGEEQKGSTIHDEVKVSEHVVLDSGIWDMGTKLGP